MKIKKVANRKEATIPSIVVLVGQSGAGKTTVADAIGCEKIASCTILREEVARRGLEDNHANIHTVAMDMISQDPAWQAKKVLQMVSHGQPQPFIFDGPRNPADIQFLMESGQKVEVVGIYSPRVIRYQRILEREQQIITKEQFMQRCVDEVAEAGLNNCLRLATVYVFNNGNFLKEIRQCAISLMTAILSESFPKVDSIFTDGILGFEGFINTFSLPFTDSEQMCILMKEYLNWEEEQLKAYKRGEIPLEKFI